LVADRIGAYLAGKINFQGRIDGDHPIMPAYQFTAVHILYRIDLHLGVIVHEIVELPAPHAEAGHDLALMYCFPEPRYGARANEVEVGVGQVFRMDSKVPLAFKVSEDRIVYSSGPDLNCGAVLHQYGNVFGYPFRDSAPLPENDLDQWLVIFHEVVNPGHMKEAVAQCPGHLRVYLSNNYIGGFDSAFVRSDGNSHRTVSMLVRRCNLNQCDV